MSREDYGLHVVSAIIDPGKPWQNGTNESFNGKFRNECLSIEWFRTGREAHVVIEAWRQHYYTVRPHSSIGDLTPHEFKPHHPPIQTDPTEPSQNNRLNFPTQVSPTAGQTKLRAGSKFIRRVSAMPIFSIRTVVLAVAVSASSLSSAATLSAQSELLCSPEGLMRLIPQFNVNGQFTIPDPNTDLQTFLSAQQGLSNAIEMILAQENMSQNPADVGSLPSRPLVFASNWLSSEVGIQTDGTNLTSPEAAGKFGGYRVRSFLTGLTPVSLSRGNIYAIKQSNPTYQALVYPMPTSHPCVNRLFLAAGDTAGSWPPPTYALGRYQVDSNGLPMRDRPLITYLIVNICLDLAKPAVINKRSVLRPNAMIILAFHWPCEGSGCATSGIGHPH